jgi:hypothetical protein
VQATVVGAGFSESSSSFFTASGTSVKIWDAETGKLTRHLRAIAPHDITRLSLTKDGRLCMLSDSAGGTSVSASLCCVYAVSVVFMLLVLCWSDPELCYW